MPVKPEPVSQTSPLPAPNPAQYSFFSLQQVIAKIEKTRDEWESYVKALRQNQWLSFDQPILANLAAYKEELDNLPNNAVVVRERGYAIIRALRLEVERRGTESTPLLYDSYGTPEHAVYKRDQEKYLKHVPIMQAAKQIAMHVLPAKK